MICSRGDLILVPFPFTDLSSAKRRPVLVLADPDGYGDFLGVAVTSRPHHSNAIGINGQDMERGGLPTASWVRTDRVITLNILLVSKVFGVSHQRFRGASGDRGLRARRDTRST